MSEIERDPSPGCGTQSDETRGNAAWSAPRMIALEKISNAQKISWNTEHGVISGLS